MRETVLIGEIWHAQTAQILQNTAILGRIFLGSTRLCRAGFSSNLLPERLGGSLALPILILMVPHG